MLDALQIVERIGKCWFAAELNRQKGQLLLRQGRPVYRWFMEAFRGETRYRGNLLLNIAHVPGYIVAGPHWTP